MDPYDALNAFYFLKTLYSKRQTALKGKGGSKEFDTKSSSSIRLKDSTKKLSCTSEVAHAMNRVA
jgi:hypothetical protein